MKPGSIIILIILLCSQAFADTDITGFVKLSSLYYDSPFDSEENYEVYQINRVSLLSYLTDNLSFEASYELIQIYSDVNSNELITDYSQIKKPYRIDDLKTTISEDDPNYYLNQNIDRLTLTWSKPAYSIVLGRQQIAFGSGKTVNPTDIFSPLSYTAIDTEVRNGVDALRFRHQLGEMGQIDMGIVTGENAKEENSAAYILTKVTLGKFEIQPIYSYFQKAELYGIDIGTTLFGASIWLESAWVKPEIEESYQRTIVGAETQLTQDITFFIEYYYNEAGGEKPSEYTSLKSKFAYMKGGTYLLGQNYLNLGSTIQITPLHILSTSVIGNLNDESTFINLSWEWNFLEDFYFNAGSFICLGKKSDDINNPESEFGSMPTTVFIRLRYYF